MKALVVIPTYNEAENLRPIVERVLDSVPKANLLIVDDNSPDGTGKMADEMASKNSRIHVIHRPGKQGLGKAYVAGFKYALSWGADRVIQMDADFSHNPRYLPDLLRLSDQFDVVVGSRWVSGGGVENWPLHRQFLSRVGNLYARTIVGLPVKDSTAGFKCYRRRVLEHIGLDEIESTGYSFQLETITRALRSGFSIKEMPITFVERAAGTSKMSKAIVFEAMKMAWRLRSLQMENYAKQQVRSRAGK